MFPIVIHLRVMSHSFRGNILNYLDIGLLHQLIGKVVSRMNEHNCPDNLWIRQMLLCYPEKLSEIIRDQYNLFFIYVACDTNSSALEQLIVPKCKLQNWTEEFRFLAQLFMTTIRKLSPFRTETMDIDSFFINFSFDTVVIRCLLFIIMHISFILDKRFLFHEYSGFFRSFIEH